jgi:hypothetical protein
MSNGAEIPNGDCSYGSHSISLEVDRWEGKDYTVNFVREQEVMANRSSR